MRAVPADLMEKLAMNSPHIQSVAWNRSEHESSERSKGLLTIDFQGSGRGRGWTG